MTGGRRRSSARGLALTSTRAPCRTADRPKLLGALRPGCSGVLRYFLTPWRASADQTRPWQHSSVRALAMVGSSATARSHGPPRDAAIAAAQPYDLSAELAADGVDEWLERLVDLPWRGDVALDDGRALALTANDIPISWTVVGRGHGIQLSRGPAVPSADVHLSGPATDLLLALMRRETAESSGCSVEGDLDTWDTWLARTPF